jgi:hypothetical protein
MLDKWPGPVRRQVGKRLPKPAWYDPSQPCNVFIDHYRGEFETTAATVDVTLHGIKPAVHHQPSRDIMNGFFCDVAVLFVVPRVEDIIHPCDQQVATGWFKRIRRV